MSAVLEDLARRGYTDQFHASSDGRLIDSSGRLHELRDIVVDRRVRVEGSTDPSYQSLVHALRSLRWGNLGTYSVPHGSEMALEDARIVQELVGVS